MSEDVESEDSDHQQRLGRAATSLRRAEELVEGGDLEDQLYAEAETLEELGTRDLSPDGRRLRGHRHTLRGLLNRVERDAQEHVSEALDNVVSVEDAVGLGSGPH